MAPDERDRSFDKALARHLRSAAPVGEGARLPEAPLRILALVLTRKRWRLITSGLCFPNS